MDRKRTMTVGFEAGLSSQKNAMAPLGSFVDQTGQTSSGQEHADSEVDVMSKQYDQMMNDLNDLGDGLAECLKRTKESFTVSQRFSRVVDRYYNGSYNRDFALQAEGQVVITQHDNVRRYRELWANANEKERPSAAFVNVDRAMNPLRYFKQQSGFSGPVKQKQRERSTAMKEANKRVARLRKLRAAWQPNEAKIQTVEAELEAERGRFRILNTELKQLILKEKIARDSIVEDYVITTICCQAEIYRALSKDLSDLVQQLPAEKVMRVQSQIKDLVQLGGPDVRKKDPTAFQGFMAAALGVRTFKEQKKEKAAEDAVRIREEEERHHQVVKLASAEEHVREQQSSEVNRGAAASSALPRSTVTWSGPAVEQKVEQPAQVVEETLAPIEVVMGLFKHEAEESDELDFNPGDVIAVLSKDDSGWWSGRNEKTGAVGIFPSNYTQPKNADVGAPPPRPSSGRLSVRPSEQTTRESAI